MQYTHQPEAIRAFSGPKSGEKHQFQPSRFCCIASAQLSQGVPRSALNL